MGQNFKKTCYWVTCFSNVHNFFEPCNCRIKVISTWFLLNFIFTELKSPIFCRTRKPDYWLSICQDQTDIGLFEESKIRFTYTHNMEKFAILSLFTSRCWWLSMENVGKLLSDPHKIKKTTTYWRPKLSNISEIVF